MTAGVFSDFGLPAGSWRILSNAQVAAAASGQFLSCSSGTERCQGNWTVLVDHICALRGTTLGLV